MGKILTVDDLSVGQRVLDEMSPSDESQYGTVIRIDYNSDFPIVVKKDDGKVGNYAPGCFIKI